MSVKLTPRETNLWAKKHVADGAMLWLPLVAHLVDCSHVLNWLFNHWLNAGQRRFLTQTISEEEMQKLVKFLGFFHDFGKATPAFQTKKSYDNDASLDDELIERLNRNGFSELRVGGGLSSPQKSPHALAGEAILESDLFNVPVSVGAIIGGHHGKPTEESPKSQLKDYTANFVQVDGHVKDAAEEARRQSEKQAWLDTWKKLFSFGLDLAGYDDASEIPKVGQPQAVILEGLLIMADWLSSSEYLDVAQTKPLFPLIGLDQGYQDLDMTARYQNAISTWKQSDKWVPQKVVVTNDTDPYKKRWGFSARPVQLAMTKAIQATVDPGLVIVEAGMGIGKTEIALIAAEQLAYKTGRNGVFMGLPTQATTNAMFSRVLDWTRLLADGEGKKLQINLMQSKWQYNSDYTNLPEASNVYDHESTTDATPETRQQHRAGAVVINGWFTGKKSILTDFTVGTIDNLLLMGLKKKHLFLRHLGLSGKVVIIDEVHAYDTYMSSYLFKAMNWLGAYHVPVVILSATLPVEKRNDLITAYLKGKYGRRYQSQLIATDGWEETRAYPLLTILDGPKLEQVTEFDQKQTPTRLHVQRLDADDEGLIQAVMAKIKQGGVAGIIVNTVKRAQALARIVQQNQAAMADTTLMVLHSAFLAPERSVQEKKLQGFIGKSGQRPHKMIVIGTQVLEQSLDIDFDVLYTDMAPIDLILQRAGRLHRHTIDRPTALKTPEVFITGIQAPYEYGDANEAIYEKYLLMKSDYFLGDTVILPDDISELVQKVYDQKTDDLVPEIGAAKTKFDKDQAQEKQRSCVFQIAAPNFRPKATIHKWLDFDFRDLSKDEQSANAAVRDIQETIEVILVQCTTNGNHLLDGRLLKDVADREIAEQVIRLPLVITPNAAVVTKVITTLESRTSQAFSAWQDSPWLRGALALPLDDHLSTTIGNWRLTYTPDLGLSYTKEDEMHGESKL